MYLQKNVLFKIKLIFRMTILGFADATNFNKIQILVLVTLGFNITFSNQL